MAIALALLDPKVDVVGLTATAGSVSGATATRNLQAIVEQLDPPKWPRLGQSDAPPPQAWAGASPPAFTASVLNGGSGLGDWQFSVASLHHLRESAKLMIDIVRSDPYEVTLLTTGPLTNVELACERAPDFLDLLKGIVTLGGVIEVGGDITPAAEFNIYCNPEAARTVLRSPATKTLIPLDLTNQVVLTFEQYQRLPLNEDSDVGWFMSHLLPFTFRAYHEHLGLEGIRLHEVVAVTAVSRPELFDAESMLVDVETSGELTRGMTVFDRRQGGIHGQPNIDVLRQVDVAGVVEHFVDTIRAAV